MKGSFCPKCGKECKGIGKKKLCEDCWKEENVIVEIPETVEIDICPHCGFVRDGRNWKEVEDDNQLIYLALNKYIGDCEAGAEYEREGDTLKIDLICRKEIDGVEISQKFRVDVMENKKQCPACSRRSSGYFKSILQLRGDKSQEALRRIEDSAEELQDRRNYISKIESVSEGIDIYLSSKEITQKVLKVLKNNYSVEIKRSYELIGEKEGQKIYRNYISARIGG